ncbi:MAG: gephyrin-like molybdotransferase Glp [SAR324 cluster bacterium]|nr:gephyrin-like molybdotransferase Glp [SAR324 cluster bacterium]
MSKNDVRMRGFLRRTPVPELLTQIDGHCPTLPAESVSVPEAGRRVLAEAVTAPSDVPHFNRAAMDGYAVRGEETFGASAYNPIALQVVGQSMPGKAFVGTVGLGTTVRIMTGAPLPDGANAVLMAELAEAVGDTIQVTDSVPPEKHVGKIGEDVRCGDLLFRQRRCLRPQDLGMLVSVGIPEVSVIRKPTVELLITGSELLAPGAQPTGVQIVDSDSVMLQSLVERDGGNLLGIRHLPDNRDPLRQAMLDATADVVIVTGGTSVGVEDHGPTLLDELGELLVHGIPMRPAAPMGFGVLEGRKVFLLPGNPVSCFCAYDCFVARALRLLGGRNPDWPYASQAVRLKTKISSQIGRIEYVRLRLDDDGAEVLASGGASILSSTTQADAFFLTEEESEGIAADETISVWRYD